MLQKIKDLPHPITFRESDGAHFHSSQKSPRGNLVKAKIARLLKESPRLPRPSNEQMLAMLHSGHYLELIPYFKEELGSARTQTSVKLRIMKILDPSEWSKILNRRRLSNKRYRKRKKQRMNSLSKDDDPERLNEDEDSDSSGEDFIESKMTLLSGSQVEQNANRVADESEVKLGRLSKKDMLKIFRLGGYSKLIPYFRKEIAGLQ
jgi:hypothetical protein